MILRYIYLILATLLAISSCLASNSNIQLDSQLSELFSNSTSTGRHTNNWAVLVCSSRYWFNYRHMANTLAMYRTLKRLGLPDSNIILMLSDDVACNPRNAFPATVYANKGRQMDLYGEGIEVDYRGYEVTVESFLRLLTGKHDPSIPRSKRLLSDASSNVFIYMTGHGGNEFLKFQDNEEVSAYDVADAVEQMWEKRRYNKLLFTIDTCQANTMYSKFYSPEITSTGSSSLGENSYSHHNDMDIGVAVIDSFTHYILQYLETLGKTSTATLKDFFGIYDPVKIQSHPGISTSLSSVPPEEILVTDFFGAVARVEVSPKRAELSPLSNELRESKWEVVAKPTRRIGRKNEDVDFEEELTEKGQLDTNKWQKPLKDGKSELKKVIGSLVGIGAIGGLLYAGGAPRDKSKRA
ncbi:phosphatidylinositol glycan, class K [Kwoniella mangroviensis CBS 10435]|uniref:Phosphatidylinositol glycan, class K n=1 Tax=Kwoniella mangroviensis CBS 10435 TaxID=1331196 RepID=A0A1B9IFN3_9TREE|nr:phosphatidylinositol glycan, class K [Kwoniella mangroviensis CBS 10435]